MAKKETTNHAAPVLPMLKTVEQMSKVSGIGENKLRELMDNGELEYVQNGNRRLIAIRTAPAIPISKSIGAKLGSGFAKAIENPSPSDNTLPDRSAPGERRTACPTLSKRYTKNR